ncbi:hypothetical protein [Streptomyces solicathayae]|uniref:Uncharacterized protein n=1 Tax=Streptomyces solicathayae TaxID=3081768 RepID=A0ABZ0LQN3_9ACTN|nr:hypothetical protein [Streptomyces sp. HUAS YS2]WOX21615.1 hypothetical protein R2D22_09475 [Streptomyces sp. HUAS YS2]
MHRAQLTFLVVNAVPLTVGILVFPFTDVASAPVYGRLTLGVLWGLLQGGLFVASTWWHEHRSTRSCDPIEQSLTSGLPQAGTSDASSADDSWRWGG